MKRKADAKLKKELEGVDPTLDKHTMNIPENLSVGIDQTIPDPDDVPGGINPDGSAREDILESIAEAKLEESETPDKLRKHK